MPYTISTPNPPTQETASAQNHDFHFGCYEMRGKRKTQEDALVWLTFEENAFASLTPEDIGHRLWTTYQHLHVSLSPEITAGTTASTTVFDGRGNLITATLADAVSFAAIYDKAGNIHRVIRLNSVTHSPMVPAESDRIKKAGGVVLDGRVSGILAVSRAIGDNHALLRKAGVTSDATIDIHSLSELISNSSISREEVGSIQIITTCDGFTEKAPEQTKEAHEAYLKAKLTQIENPSTLSEEELSRQLASLALSDDSRDNISVAIQTLTADSLDAGTPFLMGVYDGHGGDGASIHVATKIDEEFKAQYQLSREAYAKQEWSVFQKVEIYNRDHSDRKIQPEEELAINPDSSDPLDVLETPSSESEQSSSDSLDELEASPNELEKDSSHLSQETPLPKPELDVVVDKLKSITLNYQQNLNIKDPILKGKIETITTGLITILENPTLPNQDKIQAFYQYLDAPYSNGVPYSNDAPYSKDASTKNIDIIKQDNTRVAKNFLKFVAILAATILTGILPGLLIMGICYAATKKHPLQLLQTEGKRFANEIMEEKPLRQYSMFNNESQPLLKEKEEPIQDQQPPNTP
ncbi:PP2C family serine/threonine-protein phosphatase [Legionella impletisoli]|uniref:PPM-type phosphatase domain-containing protein n=1 Tax=Legionella impletisoli TaxID=343510 RepID=A0A917NE60_9GAMM|nr:PP2C family protein-serine/threonine phosphatase [Legionella impletisoli]GGI91967.1 hypothetical protein GCM10007966_20790 [Legionella impletisoli]